MFNSSDYNGAEPQYAVFHGLKFVEVEGVPAIGYLAKVLIEFGAEVCLLRTKTSITNSYHSDFMNEGKQIKYVDKSQKELMNDIFSKADVLLNNEDILGELGLSCPYIQNINQKLVIMNFIRERKLRLKSLDNKETELSEKYCADSALIPFTQLLKAIVASKDSRKGMIVETAFPSFNSSFDVDSLTRLKKRVNFTIVSKNHGFLYLEMIKEISCVKDLQKLCENLYIETLNQTDEIQIHDRLDLTNDYINNFDSICSNEKGCVKSIKKLSKLLTSKTLVKLVGRLKGCNARITEVCQFDDICEFVKSCSSSKRIVCLMDVQDFNKTRQNAFKINKFNNDLNDLNMNLATNITKNEVTGNLLRPLF